jgi:hypothetical protein
MEAGRVVAKDWEIQTIAEIFGVKPDYFASKASSEEPETDGLDVPAKRAAPKGKGGAGLDFSEFNYFKEAGAPAPAAPAKPAPPAEKLADLAPDLFDDSSSVEAAPLSSVARGAAEPPPSKPSGPKAPAAKTPEVPKRPAAEKTPASAKAASAPKPAPAPRVEAPRPAPPPPPPPPPPPQGVSDEPIAMPGDLTPPNAADARYASLEALVYVKALSEVLLGRGLFTKEEFARALRRARGG